MDNGTFARRASVNGAGSAAVAAAGSVEVSSAERQVPHSSGAEAPTLKAPLHSCDCHLHIYDPRFPPPGPAARLVTNAGVEQYRLLQKRIGTTRAVIVTPSAYATANAVTLDAIARLGSANARGVGEPVIIKGAYP